MVLGPSFCPFVRSPDIQGLEILSRFLAGVLSSLLLDTKLGRYVALFRLCAGHQRVNCLHPLVGVISPRRSY